MAFTIEIHAVHQALRLVKSQRSAQLSYPCASEAQRATARSNVRLATHTCSGASASREATAALAAPPAPTTRQVEAVRARREYRAQRQAKPGDVGVVSAKHGRRR